MSNPILVELTRGETVESVHRGAIAIADSHGVILASLGDIANPAFPRSSFKMLQALPLVETGAAAAYGVSDEEIALACASHSAEPMHTERVAAWLRRLDLSADDLACGPHPVPDDKTREAMICAHRSPTAIHNNCSGKHTGFLTLAKHLGAPIAGYEKREHPVQQIVAAAIHELCEVPADMPWGIDGCAAPNYAQPLSGFAKALAKFADPAHQRLARGAAMRRIVQAMIDHPELVSGTGRVCATLMHAGQGEVAVKTGAEGFFAAIVPGRGIGIALKIDDGTMRAAECTMAVILESLGLLNGDPAAMAIAHAQLTNTRGTVVGERRAAEALRGFRL